MISKSPKNEAGAKALLKYLAITSALYGLQGQFFTNNNLIAVASLVAVLPTLVVYFALQKQFIGGLTLGATKG